MIAKTLQLNAVSSEFSDKSLADSIERFAAAGARRSFSEGDLAGCFNFWINHIGANPLAKINAIHLHRYRIFLSTLAPDLFPKSVTGQVAYDMTPSQFIYLLDDLVASGGLPAPFSQITPSIKIESLRQSYFNSLDAYRAGRGLADSSQYFAQELKRLTN